MFYTTTILCPQIANVVNRHRGGFLHVKLNPKDQNFTHFLWLPNPKDPESFLDNYHFKVRSSIWIGKLSIHA